MMTKSDDDWVLLQRAVSDLLVRRELETARGIVAEFLANEMSPEIRCGVLLLRASIYDDLAHEDAVAAANLTDVGTLRRFVALVTLALSFERRGNVDAAASSLREAIHNAIVDGSISCGAAIAGLLRVSSSAEQQEVCWLAVRQSWEVLGLTERMPDELEAASAIIQKREGSKSA